MTTRRNLMLALGIGVLARAGPLRSQPGSAVRRVGVLGSSTRAKDDVTLVSFYDEMRQLGWVEGRNLVQLDLVLAEAANLAELESAVVRLADQRVDALLAASALTFNLRARFIELASARRIPVVGTSAPMAQAGALFTYGPTLAARHRRQAQLVDQVLRWANPAEMPVEQPTQFELVLNLKTAKLLGITIPQAVLLRADEVIE